MNVCMYTGMYKSTSVKFKFLLLALYILFMVKLELTEGNKFVR